MPLLSVASFTDNSASHGCIPALCFSPPWLGCSTLPEAAGPFWGAGASRLGDWGSHMWSYHIAALLVELGLRVALLPTMYVGLGAEGEPYGAGAGWAADILPSPRLRSTSAAVVRIGNRCLAHATESSHLPFGSCMDFGKCNEFCVLQLMENVFLNKLYAF